MSMDRGEPAYRAIFRHSTSFEYNSANNQMIGINTEGQLFYTDTANNIYTILNTIEGVVYKAFFLEGNKLVVGSYIEKPNHIARFLFGENPMIKHYSYYSVSCNDAGVVSIKKIKTINSLWRLEQLQGRSK